jgi:hypothetical protein
MRYFLDSIIRNKVSRLETNCRFARYSLAFQRLPTEPKKLIELLEMNYEHFKLAPWPANGGRRR